MKINVSNKFLAGILTHAAIQSLLQDLQGKEGYIRNVQEHWVDWKISVPIALAVWLLAFWLSGRED